MLSKIAVSWDWIVWAIDTAFATMRDAVLYVPRRAWRALFGEEL